MHATSSVATPHVHSPQPAAQTAKAAPEATTAAAEQAPKAHHSAPPAGTGKVMDISA